MLQREVNGESGTIKNVGISVTELDTVDNKHIIIPNKSVWGSNITNYTKNPIRRVDMEMGVGYNDDLDKVIKTTMELLKNNSRVLSDPAPHLHNTGLLHMRDLVHSNSTSDAEKSL